MKARTVNNIWTGILYAIAVSVIALLLFLVSEIIIKGWGFGILIFYLEDLAIHKQAAGLDHNYSTHFICLF